MKEKIKKKEKRQKASVVNKFSFGIGCFHFGIKKKPPFKFNGVKYIKKLRKALESISSIDNIDIFYDERSEKLSADIIKELPNIQEDEGFFPCPDFAIIEFEIYIPFRVQVQLFEQLLGVTDFSPETFTEKFKILIYYCYHFPVAFVETINPSKKNIPSKAVVVVREFLEREFKDLKSDYIRFEFMGPSPLHADCHIEPGEDQIDEKTYWRFRSKLVPKRGYDEIIFRFNQSVFKKPERAKEEIFREIVDELGFLYSIIKGKSVKMDECEHMGGLVNRLISIQREKGIAGFFKRLLVSFRMNEIFISIAEFESKELSRHSITQEHYRNIYVRGEDSHFQPYVKREIEERFICPTKQISRLVNFFGVQRDKNIQYLIVLISAIIGGVAGALITIFLSSFPGP